MPLPSTNAANDRQWKVLANWPMFRQWPPMTANELLGKHITRLPKGMKCLLCERYSPHFGHPCQHFGRIFAHFSDLFNIHCIFWQTYGHQIVKWACIQVFSLHSLAIWWIESSLNSPRIPIQTPDQEKEMAADGRQWANFGTSHWCLDKLDDDHLMCNLNLAMVQVVLSML